MLFEFLGQAAAHAEHTGHRLQARKPQRQGIKHALGHVDPLRRFPALVSEDRSLRTGQKQMPNLSRGAEAPTIKAYQAVGGMKERNDHAAQEVFATLGVENAHLLKRVAHLALGKSFQQRAIAIAESKALVEFGVPELAVFEVLAGLLGRLQAVLIVPAYLL